jgi:hypothetical protein
MLYFRVLPSDPRFQSLNFFQKLVLISGMRAELEPKIEIYKHTLDKALLYMNPDLWLKEKEVSGEMVTPGKKVNTEFKKIQAHGQATGFMPEDTRIADAIKKLNELSRTRNPEDMVYLTGELDNLQEQTVNPLIANNFHNIATPDDPDELG